MLVEGRADRANDQPSRADHPQAVPVDAQKAVGHEQIAGALATFLASPFKLRGKYAMVHAAGSAALCSLKWEMLEPEGWINSDGVSMEVLTRGSDGLWRFAIDDATAGQRPGE